MEQRVLDTILDRVRDRLEHNDLAGAIDIIERLYPPDQADILSELEPEQQEALLTQLETEQAADILEELEDEEAAEIASRLPLETLSDIVDEMETDEAADLLGDMEPEQASEVLARMRDADDVRPLLLHKDETAGGLMTSEFLALRERMTVRQALEAVRQWSPEKEEAVHYLFIVDDQDRLQGLVSLYELIKAGPDQRLGEIMSTDVISVPAGADQEQCAHLMRRYDLYALPVVDAGNRLIGVITVDDIVDVIVDEQSEDMERFGGSLPLDKPYLDTSVFQVARKRMGWLFLLFVADTFTGTVLRHFEHELAAVVALSFFIPLLIGTGGNAGSQTTSTIIRGLATGEIRIRDAIRVFWHEARVGFFLGLMMGTAAFIRAITWDPSHPLLAIAVGTAAVAIVFWANCLGSLLPIIAARLKIDPAIVSGPFMATMVDATGLYIYFRIAKLILGI